MTFFAQIQIIAPKKREKHPIICIYTQKTLSLRSKYNTPSIMVRYLRFIIIYLLIINIITFVAYGVDKWKARNNKWRISEATLLELAIAGGSIGAWLGMRYWHHKTMHDKFRFGIPIIFVLQVILFGYLLYM